MPGLLTQTATSRFAVVDQRYAGGLDSGFYGGRGEGFEFALAGFLEAGSGGAEFVAEAAGVAHEFAQARGEAPDEGFEFGGAEAAGHVEAEEMVGEAAAVLLETPEAHGAEDGFCERAADPRDAVAGGEFADDIGHLRE